MPTIITDRVQGPVRFTDKSMTFMLERVSDPDIEPVTLTEAKRHMRMYDDITSADDDVTALIVAAREWVEDYTARALIDQSWRLTVEGYRGGDLQLYRSPVLAITSLTEVSSSNEETEVDAADYELREGSARWPLLHPLVAWAPGRLKVVYRAGYADRTGSPVQDASAVPERYKIAMKLWVESAFNRDPKLMLPLLDAATMIIKPERVNLQVA